MALSTVCSKALPAAAMCSKIMQKLCAAIFEATSLLYSLFLLAPVADLGGDPGVRRNHPFSQKLV